MFGLYNVIYELLLFVSIYLYGSNSTLSRKFVFVEEFKLPFKNKFWFSTRSYIIFSFIFSRKYSISFMNPSSKKSYWYSVLFIGIDSHGVTFGPNRILMLMKMKFQKVDSLTSGTLFLRISLGSILYSYLFILYKLDISKIGF